MISQERYDRLKEKERLIESEIERLKNAYVGTSEKVQELLESYESTPLNSGSSLAELIRRPELSYEAVTDIDVTRPELPKDLAAEVIEQVDISLKYDGYIQRQKRQVEQFKKMENKKIPEEAKIDLLISLITLKYTQSNSVCFVKDGQAIGVGAGQQSRVHCTRLAGQKADNWFLRQCPKVLDLQFVDGIRRADRDNAIDVYIGEEYMDVLADGAWEKIFKVKPEVFTREEKRAWLDQMKGVTLGSDAFFPFSDNIERAHKSGVEYIAEPGGSVRDDAVIECCNKYNMAMAFTGIRLFHH